MEAKKPFKCVFCGLSTGFKGSFRKHFLKIHDKIKPKCLICQKTFRDIFVLHNHLLKCHGEKDLEGNVKSCKPVFHGKYKMDNNITNIQEDIV